MIPQEVFEALLVACAVFACLGWALSVRKGRRQVRHQSARQRHSANREHERLEGLVVARTAQLDRRNAEMHLIFDHVEQGILTVNVDGSIASEHSAAVEKMLGPLPASGGFVDFVRGFAPVAADWVEMSWASLADGSLPAELCLAQLPARFELGGRTITATYKPFAGPDHRLRVLVVFSDETAVVERERIERDARETTALVTRMLNDRNGFVAFCAEADRYVAALGTESGLELVRAAHTLKGIAAIEGISSVAELCHDLESAIGEADADGIVAHRVAVAARWAMLRANVAPLLDLTTERLDLSFADLDRLELAIARRASHDELERQVATWRHDRIQPRLERFADHARVLASRLCKDPLEVRVDADPELRLPTGRFRNFWSTFVHAIRNAVDHGIETGSERALAGKPAVATIQLRAYRNPRETVVELEDSGRGIAWDKVAERARARGLPAETRADLEAALCEDGLSTCDEIGELSGRGVGFGAFRQACVVSGGRLTIASAPGKGTRLTVTWSNHLLAASEFRDRAA